MRCRAASSQRGIANQRGLSLVELMIGITISLFILAGATFIVSSQLADNRRMLLEVQMQQDLRSVLDMIGRDLRRAGYWGKAAQNIWPREMAPALENPYNRLTSSATSVEYDRSLDEATGLGFGTPENNQVDGNEWAGFRYNASAKRIEMLVGEGNWQALTDENVIRVNQFSVTITTREIPAPCAATCPRSPSPSNCPMVLRIRDASILITAEATSDRSVTRSVQSDVRLRNDMLAEACS